MNKTFLLFKLVIFLVCVTAQSQPKSTLEIKLLIESLKNDARGPYKSIQWFCSDGTIRAAKDPCPDDDKALQHATYKDEVIQLGKKNHLFLGQILVYATPEVFWDPTNNHSRLKQYQLGKYLARIDDGWINKKGQFYRGSVQIEDEEAWSEQFLKKIISKDENVKKNYFLLLQSYKDLPMKGEENISLLMRSQSKVISDQFQKFMDLRVKIHNNPEAVDVEKTIAFKKENLEKLTPVLQLKIDELISTMGQFHKPINIENISKKASKLGVDSDIYATAQQIAKISEINSRSKIIESSKLLLAIRQSILQEKNSNKRLILFNLANDIDQLLISKSNEWNPATIEQQLEKIYYLSMAAAGTGAIELWEWEKVNEILKPSNNQSISLEKLLEILETARGVVEWSAAMVKVNYQDIVNTYTAFEPKAYGFIDDRIRASVALELGKTVGDLGIFIAKQSGLSNKVINLENQSSIRGLNPGYALGTLVVIKENPDTVEVSSDNIYVFERAPADLKPVAGIATVTEGNLVSHVQLLARNLGIPNAVLSNQNVNDLIPYHGKKVFYAVSNKGTVLVKEEQDMTSQEKALFEKKVRKEEKITAPVSEIKLEQNSILNLKDVNAKDSGKLCGPKAANLGELKQLFPENVVDGFVIPFGIFRSHMDQPMPSYNQSYWEFLNTIFSEASKKRTTGFSETEIENFQLAQLNILREAIKNMPLKDSFTNELVSSFQNIFGKPIGGTPVFLRSDTNMEDLKDFTGAGLNLTIFNAVKKENIIQGIKDVWASPYTERSFKWRQKYLSNPENVFPSILVIPSVDVDYSGVLITKGISTNNPDEATIAFSKGAGGAVDGQAAETYILKQNGKADLLSPAREATYTVLPSTGGTLKNTTTLEQPLLNPKNIQDIRELIKKIDDKMNAKNKLGTDETFDVELGFKNNTLWLFQIRPFVENKKALSSDYLKSITPAVNTSKQILVNTAL